MDYRFYAINDNNNENGTNYFIIPSIGINKPNMNDLPNLKSGTAVYFRFLTFEVGLMFWTIK